MSSNDRTNQPKAPPIQPFTKKERTEKNTKPSHTKRWEEGSRKLVAEKHFGRWLVGGPNQETGSTSKTLVRGERKANGYAEGVGKVAFKDKENPNVFFIDHGYVANRRQRRASR